MEISITHFVLLMLLLGYLCSVAAHTVNCAHWWEPVILGAINPICSLMTYARSFLSIALVLIVIALFGRILAALSHILLSHIQ